MGFYQDIGNIYGRQTMQDLKEYSNNSRKISSLKNRVIFLIRCKSNGLFPKYLEGNIRQLETMMQYKDSRTGQQTKNFMDRLCYRIINFQLNITYKNLVYLKNRQVLLTNSINTMLPEHLWIEFKRRDDIKFNRFFYKKRDSNIRKFHHLQESQNQTIMFQEKWFKNVSSTDIPDEVKMFLSLGPKFSLPPSKKDVSLPRLMALVESNNPGRSKKEKDIVRAKATNIITNFIQQPNTPTRNYLVNLENKTKDFLRNHPDLITTISDKGGVTVLMNKSDYIDLANQQLNDSTFYKIIPRDPTSTIEQKINKHITELKNKNFITQQEARSLMTYDALCPKFYGLPKIHKPLLSLRPIISSIRSPSSRLAQFIKDILTTAYRTDNPYYVKDSFHFAEFINNVQIPDNYQIISLDVISLFTNILVESAKDSISYNWHKIEPCCKIPKEKFLELLTILFESTYFTFNNQYYKQLIGTPMGSILSPTIAQYVMDELLDKCIPQLPFEIPFCKKFVDDLILSIPIGEEDSVLQIFNNYHPNIQFTIEKESNNSVPFLDTLVIRNGNTIITDWYRKPISSGRYIHFKSYHPMSMKLNLLQNLKTRVTKLSHQSLLKDNLSKLFKLMKENNYPERLLNKIIFTTPNSQRQIEEIPQIETGEELIDGVQHQKRVLILPHIEGFTRKLAKILKTENTLVALQNIRTTKSLYTKLKDKTSITSQSNIVYRIPCTNCDLVYIGETKRTLSKRITSHKSDSKRKITACALAVHENQTGHHMDYSNIKILEFESKMWTRKYLEMIHIIQEPNSMNNRRDVEDLSSIYANLVEIDKIIKTNPQFVNDHSFESFQ